MLAAEPFVRDAKEIAAGCQVGNQGGQLLTPFHRELVDGVRVNDAHRRVARSASDNSWQQLEGVPSTQPRRVLPREIDCALEEARERVPRTFH
jgi:hypothetical protein